MVQKTTDVFQNLVTDDVPVGIVDFLEVVQVNNHHAERCGMSTGAGDLTVDGFQHVVPVVQTSQLIVHG